MRKSRLTTYESRLHRIERGVTDHRDGWRDEVKQEKGKKFSTFINRLYLQSLTDLQIR